jgi:hypothetical protein
MEKLLREKLIKAYEKKQKKGGLVKEMASSGQYAYGGVLIGGKKRKPSKRNMIIGQYLKQGYNMKEANEMYSKAGAGMKKKGKKGGLLSLLL